LNQFANKVTITNEHGKKLWAPDKSRSESENIRELVIFLGNILGEKSSYVDQFLEAISYKVLKKDAFKDQRKGRPINRSAQSQTTDYDGIIFTKLWTVIKCLSGDIHQPALLKMRETFYDILPFRDVRRSWLIKIQISSTGPITIIHRKLEESPNQDFYFEWLLIITLGKGHRKIDGVDFRINDFGFSEFTSEETRKLVKTNLKPFYQPRDDIPIVLDVENTLTAIIDRVKELPRTNVFHPDLPHSIDLLILLTHLQKNLNLKCDINLSDSNPSDTFSPSISPERYKNTLLPHSTPPPSPSSLYGRSSSFYSTYSRSPGGGIPLSFSISPPLSPLMLSSSGSILIESVEED